MPSVADLHPVGQGAAGGLGVGGRAVPAHDLDTGMLAQPGLQGGRVAVGQDRDASSGLGIRDDRGVTVAAAQGEIVHADHPRDGLPGQREAPQMVQRGAAGDGHGQETGQACGRPAARLPCYLRYLRGETRSAALMTHQQSGNLCTEGLPRAAQNQTDQPSYAQVADDRAAVGRSRTVRRWYPCILAAGVRHAGHGTAASRVRAVTTTSSPSPVTSSTTTADSPENTVPMRERTSEATGCDGAVVEAGRRPSTSRPASSATVCGSPRRGSPRVDRPLASAAPPRGRGSGQRDVRGAGARSLPLPCLSVRRVSGVRRPAPVRPRRTTR